MRLFTGIRRSYFCCAEGAVRKREKALGRSITFHAFYEDCFVADLVVKQSAYADLLSALRAAHRGGLFVDPALAGAWVALPRNNLKGPMSARLLSDREQQVLQLVATTS